MIINVCPNCWGIHEYGAEFTPYVEAMEREIQSKDKGTKKAFIMKFVEERITGITLKRESGELVCPACTNSYPEKR